MPSDDTPTGFALDRNLQGELLRLMKAVYPDPVQRQPVIPGAALDAIFGNLHYLQEQGLCSSGLKSPVPGTWAWTGARITARGLDFLEQDGGLTAILGVVTVKLHADTIRDMLAAKIDASDLPAEKKSAMKEAIGKLPGAALTAAAGDLAKMGLEHAPGALVWIQRLIGIGN